MLLLCEIKKLWKRPLTYCLVIFALVSNIFAAIHTCSAILQDSYYQGGQLMLQDHGGILTKEKVRWIEGYYAKMSERVQNGTFSTELNEDCYSGYEFSDYNIVMQLYERLNTIRYYKTNTEETIGQLKRSAELYEKAGNPAKAKLYSIMASQIKTRNIPVLQDDSLFQAYIGYRFSSYIAIFLAFALFTGLAAADSGHGVKALTTATVKGNKWLNIIQPAAAFIVYMVVGILLFAEDVMIFGILSGGIRLGQPLYYVAGYEYTFFQGTVGAYILITAALKLLGIAVFGILCNFLTVIIHKQYPALLMCLLLLVAMLSFVPWTETLQPIWPNPLNSLICMEWFKEPEYTLFLGKYILYYRMEGIIICFQLAACSLLIQLWTYVKKRWTDYD